MTTLGNTVNKIKSTLNIIIIKESTAKAYQ